MEINIVKAQYLVNDINTLVIDSWGTNNLTIILRNWSKNLVGQKIIYCNVLQPILYQNEIGMSKYGTFI